MSKELLHSNNAPEVQELVDHGKRIEWETLLAKGCAVRVHHGKRAQQIKRGHPDRFIGSRFVLTRKPIDEGKPIDPLDTNTYTVKGRWCLQGHLDPDLTVKAESGMLKSPTLSQLGRMRLMPVTSGNFNLVTLRVLSWRLDHLMPSSDRCMLDSLPEAFLESQLTQ